MSEEKKSSDEWSKSDCTIFGVVGGVLASAILFAMVCIIGGGNQTFRDCKDLRRDLDGLDRCTDLRYAEQQADSRRVRDLIDRMRDVEDAINEIDSRK